MDESSVHVKALLNKNGVTDSSLIRSKAQLVVPTNKIQFRLYDDADSDDWNDYVMNWGKITKYGENLVPKKTG